MKFRIEVALALACLAPPVAAQAPEPVRAGSDAAASITAPDVARRVGILADDSMMGRDTPSRGLEMTAKYVADEFRRFGLGARSRQRHLVPAVSDHAPPAAAGAVAPGAQGGRDQRDRQARRDGAPRQRRHPQTAGAAP